MSIEVLTSISLCISFGAFLVFLLRATRQSTKEMADNYVRSIQERITYLNQSIDDARQQLHQVSRYEEDAQKMVEEIAQEYEKRLAQQKKELEKSYNRQYQNAIANLQKMIDQLQRKELQLIYFSLMHQFRDNLVTFLKTDKNEKKTIDLYYIEHGAEYGAQHGNQS
jgi:F0F1-type ATP synthase membrane subunit b/b'